MSRTLEFDMRKFLKAVEDVPTAISTGTKRGLQDVLNDWQREARDVAPLDKGALRRNIKTEMTVNDALKFDGSVSANVYNNGFNYGFYIHEVKGDSFRGRRPGTIGKFIDKPAEERSERWLRHIDGEINAELKARGW